MPTSSPRYNSHQVGDVVHMAGLGNGAREGVLWRVTKVKPGRWVWVEPILTLTGPSRLRPRRAEYHEVHAVSIIDLATARAALDNIINDTVRKRSDDGTSGYDALPW